MEAGTRQTRERTSDNRQTDNLTKYRQPHRMTRGNQRELARAKNAKRQADSSNKKKEQDGLSAAARKERDAEVMRQKQKKAREHNGPAEMAAK